MRLVKILCIAKRVTGNGVNDNHFHAGTPHGILSTEGL